MNISAARRQLLSTVTISVCCRWLCAFFVVGAFLLFSFAVFIIVDAQTNKQVVNHICNQTMPASSVLDVRLHQRSIVATVREQKAFFELQADDTENTHCKTDEPQRVWL